MAVCATHFTLPDFCFDFLPGYVIAHHARNGFYFDATNVVELQNPHVIVAAIDTRMRGEIISDALPVDGVNLVTALPIAFYGCRSMLLIP